MRSRLHAIVSVLVLLALTGCRWERLTYARGEVSPYARLQTSVDSANVANRAIHALTGEGAVIVVVNFDTLTPPIPMVAGRLTTPDHFRLRVALDSATVAFRAIYAAGGRGSLAMVPEATPPVLVIVGLR